MAGDMHGHYKARGEVLLRLEFINSKQSKVPPRAWMLWGSGSAG